MKSAAHFRLGKAEPVEKYTNYKAFWPFYVSQHRQSANRRLHFVGTLLVILLFAWGMFQPWAFALLPICGYGFAWIGHYFFEKNQPATFRYPIYSLIADFHMFGLMCLGRMERELGRMQILSSDGIR